MPSWSVTLREAERGRGYHGSTAGDRPHVVQAPGLSTHQGSSENFPQDPQDPQHLPVLSISEVCLPQCPQPGRAGHAGPLLAKTLDPCTTLCAHPPTWDPELLGGRCGTLSTSRAGTSGSP